MRGSRRGTGGLDPLKKHKNIGFLSNTGPDPLKITKLSSQHSILGHQWHACETPFKWRLAGGADDGPIIVIFGPPTIINKKKTKKNVKLDPL